MCLWTQPEFWVLKSHSANMLSKVWTLSLSTNSLMLATALPWKFHWTIVPPSLPKLSTLLKGFFKFVGSEFLSNLKQFLSIISRKIAPGENVTHSVVVRPRSYGIFNHTAAQITYYPKEDSKEVRVGFTTAPGEGNVYRLRDYERLYTSKWSVWFVFFLLAGLTTALPFSIWWQLRNKCKNLFIFNIELRLSDPSSNTSIASATTASTKDKSSKKSK